MVKGKAQVDSWSSVRFRDWVGREGGWVHLQRKLPSTDRDCSYDGDWWGGVTYVKVRNVQVRICGGAKSSGLVVVFAGASE